MDPRYRFALVLSFGLVGWWVLEVVSTYLVGPTGLNWARYLEGVVVLATSALAGWLLVWLSSKALAWRKALQTGFEPSFTDEFGTEFAMAGPEGSPVPFKLALSKFNPALVAPPTWPGLTPLEAELIGFLQGFAHWPASLKEDLRTPKTTLYEHALARWQVVRTLPGATPLVRALALSTDLAMVHALEEIRKIAPWWQFWQQDQSAFKVRTRPHGGLSSLVLSTLPAFRALAQQPNGSEQQRAMLTALRFADTPELLPLNAPDESRTMLDILQRAEAQVAQLDIRDLDTLTPELAQELNDELLKQWARAVQSLLEQPGTWRMGGTTPLLAVPVPTLLRSLGPCLPSRLRQVLQLWDVSAHMLGDTALRHPAWSHLGSLLQNLGLITNHWQDMPANNGTFMLAKLGEATRGTPSVLMVADHPTLIPLKKELASLENVAAEPVATTEQLGQQIAHKAGVINAELGQLF